MMRALLLLFLAYFCTALSVKAEWREAEFSQLSDRNVSVLGQAALSIRAADWRHAESEHFVYHYFQSFVAAPVSAEAEFYYGVIAREMGKDTARWERKCHVFVFEDAEDWGQFKTRGQLDPWTGGLHAQGELFVLRNAERRWKGHTLAHEVTHLVIHRFLGNGMPRWLNEGFAEYAGVRGYAAFQRARGYLSRPVSQSVDPAQFIPLAKLTAMLQYPTEVEQVRAFYDESERLVRFLSAADKRGFGIFLEAMSQGALVESALVKGFGSRFPSLEALEREFKTYASKDYAPAD